MQNKTIDFSIPTGWSERDLNGDRIPWRKHIGDLVYNAKYAYRGIGFMLDMKRNSQHCYYLELRYWHSFNHQWVSLGELDTTNGVKPEVLKAALDPIADVLIGKGKQWTW